MKRHAGNLYTHSLVKEANLKRVLSIQSQLYDILEKAKPWRSPKDPWLPGVRGRGG